MIAPKALQTARIAWRPCLRLIASRYPTVGLYDEIADAADLDVVYAIEALTNPRVRGERGEQPLLPADERVTGAGSAFIMAAFAHLNPEGSRFSDGSYGIYYAAETLETAIAEVSHHRTLFLARTQEPPIDVDLRLIAADLDAPLHDLRGWGRRARDVYNPDHYGASQRLGLALRGGGSWGLVYDSVRHAGGICVALFRPRALRAARQSAHIALHWDGQRITHWYRKQDPQRM